MEKLRNYSEETKSMSEKFGPLPKVIGAYSNEATLDLGEMVGDVVVIQKPEKPEELSDYIHDIRSAARAFKLMVQMIEDGERFEDDYGRQILAQVKKSLKSFDPAISFFKEISEI